MNEPKMLDISVLYVEDDALTRDEVEHFLRRRVRKLATASNGREGLEQFRRDRPDLIVTDIRMPVLGGLQMAQAMRSEDREILIVVTSAHSDLPHMLDAIDIGIDQYVTKPINIKQLVAAIEKCAETIELRREHQRFLAEREKLIDDLQKALAEIKTLRGIVPICSFCHKIRDDKGAWQQMEIYIRDHSEAEFSHGVCEECAEKHYGRIVKKFSRPC